MTKNPFSPFIEQAETVNPLQVVGEQIRVLAPATRTGSYEIFLQSGAEGAGPPPHTHPWDEAYFVIEGRLELLLGDRKVEVSPGSFAYVPRGTTHAFRILEPSTKFLSMNSHGGAAEFFSDVDRETRGAFDLPRLLSVAERHEIAIAAP
jgi:quercetin dioxygenase-like cupin family protein